MFPAWTWSIHHYRWRHPIDSRITRIKLLKRNGPILPLPKMYGTRRKSFAPFLFFSNPSADADNRMLKGWKLKRWRSSINLKTGKKKMFLHGSLKFKRHHSFFFQNSNNFFLSLWRTIRKKLKVAWLIIRFN